MKLKVALIVNGLGVGGLERHALTLSKHLDPSHIDLELIYLKDVGALKPSLSDLSVPVWSPKLGSGVDVGGILRLSAHLKQRQIQAAIASNQYATLVAVMARRLRFLSLELFSGFHSVPEHIGHGLRDRLLLEMYERSLSSCQGLVYVSRKQQEVWTAKGFARHVASRVIPNGIDPGKYWPAPQTSLRQDFGWSPEDFVVGLCASLRPEKRVEDLIEASVIAIERGVPLRLLIVGDGPQSAFLAELIARLLPAGIARMVGFQSDVIPFVHACDVMALVSDAEAFSISVLEAMACGKPVVLSDVGGAREQIVSGVHGYVVPVRAPLEIAVHLDRLWRNGEAKKFGEAARARVAQEFSVQIMADRYAELLLKSINNGTPQVASEIASAL